MKFATGNRQEIYEISEDAFIPPLGMLSPLFRQYYLWKFYHEPGFNINKQRCNTLLHGYSTPRGGIG